MLVDIFHGLMDYIYPRMYGMSGATSLLLVYPHVKSLSKSDFLQLAIEDIGMNTGEVKFQIDMMKIINEPKINFK